MTRPSLRWQAPVKLEDVPEAGLHLDLVADAAVRAGLGALAEIRDLPRLTVAVDVVRYRTGLRATGRVTAEVGQTCVVTLDPIESTIDEAFDVVFLPPEAADGAAPADDMDEGPELLHDGAADLGAVATDVLLLAIDPYPRKPDAVFASPSEDSRAAGPFAVLAQFKPKRSDGA